MTRPLPLCYRREVSTWRTFGIGAALILVTAVVGGALTSIHVVAPPVAAALVVLLAAALAVDYFGLQRRHIDWTGTIVPTAATRAMLTALERRFHRERRMGALRTGATARTLLVSLAEHRELRRAAEVVDFLATDAATRAHRDPVGDALRALALAELGRVDEARVVERSLGRAGDRAGLLPAVAYARGRIAELQGRVADGLRHVERGLGGDRAPRRGALRDLGLLRARLLARAGRVAEARDELQRVARVAGGRAAVEALIAPGEQDLGVALAAREALGIATVYR